MEVGLVPLHNRKHRTDRHPDLENYVKGQWRGAEDRRRLPILPGGLRNSPQSMRFADEVQ